MNGASTRRTAAGLALTGGVAALVGNGLAPRFNGDDVDVYRRVADSGRFTAAELVVLLAVVLVTAAFVAIGRSWRGAAPETAFFGLVAAAVGGTIAVVQTAVSLYGYKQQAQAFADANSHNAVSAFWATNALDHLGSALLDVWTVVLLGIAPVLVGAAQLAAGGRGRALGYVAVLGGVVCIAVGIVGLLHGDQSDLDVPFAVGSVLVTLWLLATGLVLWRREEAPAAAAA